MQLTKKVFLVFVLIILIQVVNAEISLDKEYVDNQVIVKLKYDKIDDEFLNNYNIKKAEKILVPNNKIKDKIEKVGLNRLYLIEVDDVEDTIKKLNKDSRIEYAEPNYIIRNALIPNDARFNEQWNLHNTGQNNGVIDADIDAVEAWDITRDSNLVVGILDTGIDYTHEDLAANIWINPGEIAGNNLDDDGNGFVDDVNGYDFDNNDNNTFDDNGHGSHVAGIIAAKGNNNLGVAGVNFNGKLAALKMLDNTGAGRISDAIEAISYAVMMDFKITSNSWVTPLFSQSLYDAVALTYDNGDLFVAAAGNGRISADTAPYYPAAFNLSNIISVAATDRNDLLASFSSFSNNLVDLAAPGVDVLSTVPKGGCSLCYFTGYKTLSGTSMATPHVSGAAALIWTRNPGLSNLDVKNEILNNVDTLISLQGKTLTDGRLNLYNIFETDNINPGAIDDLAVASASLGAVTLTWTATGDDNNVGKANRYDIRYSLNVINENNWESAVQVEDEPIPKYSGSLEEFKIKGLLDNTNYYFAIKAVDNKGNYGGLSNLVNVATPNAITIFFDDMENSNNNWEADSLWHLENYRYYSCCTSFAYNTGEPDYNYNIGYSIGILKTPNLDLRGYSEVRLRFKYFYETEKDTRFDQRWIGVFSRLVQLKNDPMLTWLEYELDLSNFTDNQYVDIDFIFDSPDIVNDAGEGWYVDDVEISGVRSGNPIADAGADRTAYLGEDIVFDGSDSFDLDGNIILYLWDFGDGFTSTGKIANHSYNTSGVFTATLTVTDNEGLVGEDSALITITEDTVSITKAQYLTSKSQLTVEAVSTRNGEAILTVENYGVMSYNNKRKVYELTISNVNYPSTVTVTSSLGGKATVSVIKRGK